MGGSGSCYCLRLAGGLPLPTPAAGRPELLQRAELLDGAAAGCRHHLVDHLLQHQLAEGLLVAPRELLAVRWTAIDVGVAAGDLTLADLAAVAGPGGGLDGPRLVLHQRDESQGLLPAQLPGLAALFRSQTSNRKGRSSRAFLTCPAAACRGQVAGGWEEACAAAAGEREALGAAGA